MYVSAAKRWEEVLKVDIKDGDAVEFFETIRRGDVVRKWQVKTMPIARPKLLAPEDIVGKSAKHIWDHSDWQFRQDGTIFNSKANQVVEMNTFWTLERDKVRTWNSKRAPSMTFTPLEGREGWFISEWPSLLILSK